MIQVTIIITTYKCIQCYRDYSIHANILQRKGRRKDNNNGNKSRVLRI